MNASGREHLVSIVLPNYNGEPLLREHLPHILSATESYSPLTEVIVVDDASTDGSIESIQNHFPSVKILRLPENVGFAKACDRGIRIARNPFVILLNTDIRIREDFIAPLVSHFADENVFAVMAMSLREDGRTPRELVKIPFFKRGHLKFVSSENPELQRAVAENAETRLYSFYAVGGHCAIDRLKYLSLGGFDDLYYPFYSEDVDLCYRAWKRGWKTIFEPKSVVCHHHVSSPIRAKHRKTHIRTVIRRNQLLFVWKNITSKKYLYLRHLLPVVFRSIGGLFVLDFNFLRALAAALRRLPLALKKRREEKKQPRVLSDEKIFGLVRSPLKNTVSEEFVHENGNSTSLAEP